MICNQGAMGAQLCKLWNAVPTLLGELTAPLTQELVTEMLVATGAMIIAAMSVFPAEMVAIGNGVTFGPVVGFVVTWAGGLIGASIAFFAARWLGHKPIRRLVSAHHLSALDSWTDRYGVSFFLLARLIPLVPFFALNYGAGLSNMRFGTYFVTTAIGIIPMTMLMVVLGDRVKELDLTSLYILGAVSVIIIGGLAWHRRQRAEPIPS